MSEEDFSIEQLASYLHLTPEQVRKMADRGRLPGRRIGGQWKFSRAEIHHWLEQRIGVSDETGLQEVEKLLENQPEQLPIQISELLTIERISFPLAARTRNSVVDRLCEFTADTGALWQPKEMAEAIRQREELHPTALENGVALLHPRRPKPSFFGESFLALGITSSGIPFGGPRGTLTDIFFLIASADESFHLKTLARISRLIQAGDLLAQMRVADSASQVWQMIADAEDWLG